MRIGLVSPYPWDVPGGVVAHIRDLAEALEDLGHTVRIMSPVDDEDAVLPANLSRAGRTVPVPYNGSVARLVFGPVSASRVRRWLREGNFDVLHVHSPESFSLSLLAVMCARGPIVATFHAANPRSRLLSLLQTPLQTQLEKIQGRIAVSPAARKTLVEHLGGDAVLIPNGVRVARFASAVALPGWPGSGGALGFLGRMDEPRKGLDVLLGAFAELAAARSGLRLLLAGPGETEDIRARVPPALRPRLHILGPVSEADKAAFFRSVDLYVAPNTGGESFGIILLEAMASRAPIVASDLEAFRRVLEDGQAGRLAAAGDPVALARSCAELLDSPADRAGLVAAGDRVVAGYDWSVVVREVLHVYEMVTSTGRSVVEEPEPVLGTLAR
ncbi:MAG TPA: glycosyltransferase family 4 protein [Mycobacteriales bacterium]|nr:glycosyltransferase family 4 protein [Mycobacteriales bacterium]